MRDGCFRHTACYVSLCRKILERKQNKNKIYIYIQKGIRCGECYIKESWILKNRAQDTEKTDMPMTSEKIEKEGREGNVKGSVKEFTFE